MNNEIKEIEEWLRDISTPTGLSYSGDRTLSNSMVDHIIDYITNLQEQLHQASLDIQELTEKDIGCPSWCDKLTNLQKENEKLIAESTQWEERTYCWQDTSSNLQIKIDKAVEVLKLCNSKCSKEVINILNGDEDGNN